ncbi:MAG: serine/threonine protein kinase, partial [Rhodopirellula sp.]|nr:serine/threonine protein kinase [Rhodopirellula sp.]
MTLENRVLLESLVDAHIRQHGGDAQHSLAVLSSDGGVLASLVNVDDSDLQASLSLLPQPEPSRPQDVGFRSSVAAPDDEHGPATHGEVPVLADGHVDAQRVSPVGDGSSTDDSSAGDSPDAKFQETLIPGTLDQFDEPKLRFRILRPHAEGGLGRVHVALDQELNREVAFKEIKFEYARRKDAQARFVVEAEVTGGLEHPGIVPVYGLGHFPDGRPFYAMRFIRGQSLHDAVREFHHAAPTTPENLPYNSNRAFRDLINRLIDVCNAIGYAHSRKVLHRDLKPGNIMLGRYGETLVVDWGLAKAQGAAEPLERSADGDLPIVPASGSQSAPTQMGNTLGTPAYMSPEQAEGKLDLLGPSCDIYSLGATLYEILTGQAPLKGLKIPDLLKRVINGEIPLPRTLNPNAPLALQAVCQKAMARRPQDRYATAKQLAEDLEAWLADEPVSAFREPLLARSRRWMRRHPALVSATAASILLTVLGLGGFSSVLAGKNEQLASANASLSDSLTREAAARTLAEDNEQRAIAGEELAKANEQRAIAGEVLAKSNAAEAARNAEEATQQRDAATVAQQLAETNAIVAREQSELALSTLNAVIFDIQRSLKNVPGGASVRNRLLASVLPQLDKVSTQFAARSAVDRNTMAALIDLADTILQLGQSGPSAPPEESLAGEAAPNAVAADPSTKSAVLTAERLLLRAHEIARQLAAADPSDAQKQRDLSVSFDRLGDVFLKLGRTDDALTQFQDG